MIELSDNPQESKTPKDLDSVESRGERGERQYEFEHGLADLRGQSIVERFFAIRDAIFFDSLSKLSSRLDILVSDNDVKGYPSRELVAEKYLPALYVLADSIHEDLAKLDEDTRADKGFRLAVINYICGILIHQATDGNGQTQKLLSLSYIREFCPEYNDHYFPIKYVPRYHDDTLYKATDDFEVFKFKVDSTLPPQIDQNAQKIFDYVKKLRLLETQSEADPENLELMGNDYGAYEKKVLALYVSVYEEIQTELGISFSNIVRESKERNQPARFNLNLRRELTSLLNKKYPGYFFSEFGDIPPYAETKEEREFILSVLLTEPEGLEAIKIFIYSGSDEMKRYVEQLSLRRKFLLNMVITFEEVEVDMDRVLAQETQEIHDEKYRTYLLLNDQK